MDTSNLSEENFNFDFGSKGMLEIKFIGRGGLGAKSAGEILALTASEVGFFVQAFPEYGAERMGAPVKSFVRISDQPIYVHSYVTNPDIVVLLDKTLTKVLDVTEGMDENSILIVNSEACDFKEELKDFRGKIYFVDASGISLKLLNHNFPNTPLLGAVAKVAKVFPVRIINQYVEKKFKNKLSDELVEKNKQTVLEAYKETKLC